MKTIKIAEEEIPEIFVAENWEALPQEFILEKGDGDEIEKWHFSETTKDVPGLSDWELGGNDEPYPDFYLSPWFDGIGDDADCGNWTFYTCDGEIV